MKSAIHPQYNSEAQVVCSCGNMFTVGSTKDSFHIELCNKCHPFYTGQQKFLDRASRIQQFESRRQKAQPIKPEREEKKEDSRPLTLREMLQTLKH